MSLTGANMEEEEVKKISSKTDDSLQMSVVKRNININVLLLLVIKQEKIKDTGTAARFRADQYLQQEKAESCFFLFN